MVRRGIETHGMRLGFFGKGDRGLLCLQALLKSDHQVVIGFVQQTRDHTCELQVKLLKEAGVPVLVGRKIGEEHTKVLRGSQIDVYLLCGLGIILTPEILAFPKLVLNLHAGPVPNYRGSSPLNWALIRGERNFGVSILKVTEKIDDGELLAEEKFRIGENDTIAHLHNRVNSVFPKLVLEVLEKLTIGGMEVKGVEQEEGEAVYFHRRFPDDGIVIWETGTAKSLIGLIRALAPPYPCARTFLGSNEVYLKGARSTRTKMVGHPGRIYQISERNGVLVGTTDWCIWISQWGPQSLCQDNRAVGDLEKYARFSTHPTSL
jgi:methionyl-tRNA formyltransferase